MVLGVGLPAGPQIPRVEVVEHEAGECGLRALAHDVALDARRDAVAEDERDVRVVEELVVHDLRLRRVEPEDVLAGDARARGRGRAARRLVAVDHEMFDGDVVGRVDEQHAPRVVKVGRRDEPGAPIGGRGARHRRPARSRGANRERRLHDDLAMQDIDARRNLDARVRRRAADALLQHVGSAVRPARIRVANHPLRDRRRCRCVRSVVG